MKWRVWVGAAHDRLKKSNVDGIMAGGLALGILADGPGNRKR